MDWECKEQGMGWGGSTSGDAWWSGEDRFWLTLRAARRCHEPQQGAGLHWHVHIIKFAWAPCAKSLGQEGEQLGGCCKNPVEGWRWPGGGERQWEWRAVMDLRAVWGSLLTVLWCRSSRSVPPVVCTKRFPDVSPHLQPAKLSVGQVFFWFVPDPLKARCAEGFQPEMLSPRFSELTQASKETQQPWVFLQDM